MGRIQYFGQRQVEVAMLEASFTRIFQRSEGPQQRAKGVATHPEHRPHLGLRHFEDRGASCQGPGKRQQTSGDLAPSASVGAPLPPRLSEITAKLPLPQSEDFPDEEPIDMQMMLRRALILEIQGMLRNQKDDAEHMPEPPAHGLEVRTQPELPPCGCRLGSEARRPGEVSTEPALPRFREWHPSGAQLLPRGNSTAQVPRPDVWRDRPKTSSEAPIPQEAFRQPRTLGPERASTESALPPPPNLGADESLPGRDTMQMQGFNPLRKWPNMENEPQIPRALHHPSSLGTGRVSTEPVLPPPANRSADEDSDGDLHKQPRAARRRAQAEHQVKFHTSFEIAEGIPHATAQPGIPLVPGIQPTPQQGQEAPANEAVAASPKLIPRSRPLLPPGLVVRESTATAPPSGSAAGSLGPKC